MGIKIKHILLLFGFILLGMSNLFSQDNKPVVHKINGKKYYLHVVEPGNTLYAISKKYTVEIDEILGENPMVKKDGLKVNQTLLIPVTKENKKEVAVIEQSKNFITYEVGPKETLYSITKKYNTTLEAILEANPEVGKEGLKAGSSIKIPYKEIEVEDKKEVKPAKLDSLQGHIVQKGETLYSLSKKYNVSQEDLMDVNNGLPFGLKEGMVLRIPGKLAELPIPAEDLIDTARIDTNTVFVPSSFKRFQIALLLPINAVLPDSNSKKEFKLSNSSKIPLSFLRGFMFATDSLVKVNDSISLDIKVYDLARDTNSARALMLSPAFQNVDIVVGPFYTDQFEYVADFMQRKGIPVVCPIPKPSKILFKRQNVIKTTPSETMQLASLAEYVAHKYADSNLLILKTPKAVDQENYTFFKSKLEDAMNVSDTVLTSSVREIQLWDINYETLSMRMRDSGDYVIVVPSKDNVFITQFISEMYNLQFRDKGKYHFTIIGLEDWLKIQDNLDVNHLQTLNVTLATPGLLSFDDYRVKKFYRDYFNEKGYEPNEFTIKGFDLGAYLINALTYQPQLWFTAPENVPYQGILTTFVYDRIIPTSGIEATGIKLYEYEDFRLKEVGRWPLQKSR